jgi:hypothetical protein
MKECRFLASLASKWSLMFRGKTRSLAAKPVALKSGAKTGAPYVST